MKSLSKISHLLSINGVIQLAQRPDEAQLFRILRFYIESDAIVLFGLDGKGNVPIWMQYSEIALGLRTHDVVVSGVDPSQEIVCTDSELSLMAKKERDRRFEIIEPLVGDVSSLVLDDKHRGSLISARAKQIGIQRNKIYDYLAMWWRHGQIRNALAPQFAKRGASGERLSPGILKRGAPRRDLHMAEGPGVNVDAAMKEKLLCGIPFLKRGMSYTQAYEEVLLRHFRTEQLVDGARTKILPEKAYLPTFRQFHHWVKKDLRPGELLRANLGETKFARQHRARTGTARDLAFGPASIYQIDATIANFYLRSHRYPDRIIGRPVIYYVVDHYSRLIVGLHVDLTGPSWESAKIALEMAFTEKVSYCRRFGIEIEEGQWPHGLCSTLTGDRGWENICASAEASAEALNYRVNTLPPYRPDYKGMVEQKFNDTHEKHIKWMAGATYPVSRGDEAHELHMMHTIKSFTASMIQSVMLYNETRRLPDPPSYYRSKTGANPTPLEVWNHGLNNIGNVRTLDREVIRANLLHVGTARETDLGLKFNQLYYIPTSDDAPVDFTRTPNRKWHQLSVRFDSRDISRIFLVNKGSTFYEFVLSSRSSEFEGYTLEEVQDELRQVRSANETHFSDDLNRKKKFQDDLKAIGAQARAEAGEEGAIARRPSADREERQAVHRENQHQNAWTSVVQPRPPLSTAISEPRVSQPASPTLASAPSHLAALHAARINRRRQLSENQE